MTFDPAVAEAAVRHLHRHDPVLSKVIRQVGPVTLKLKRDRFEALARSIVGQQISGKAAESIYARFQALLHPEKISAESVRLLTTDEFRSAGLSPQKAGYLADLAERVATGEVRLSKLSKLSDDEVIEELTRVKGIGVWTAHMFLMFSLGRPDVFPDGDLGVRSAIRNLYGLSELPAKAESIEIAAAWRPYATIASWYCWRSLELPKPDLNVTEPVSKPTKRKPTDATPAKRKSAKK